MTTPIYSPKLVQGTYKNTDRHSPLLEWFRVVLKSTLPCDAADQYIFLDKADCVWSEVCKYCPPFSSLPVATTHSNLAHGPPENKPGGMFRHRFEYDE